ncbi:DUF1415 domain-containing protein [Marinobacter salicampi]|uniref:DUF1415 domain-containing protein n=1 Tax=Marinobacter salicampi TaxID=435907 RepID=UPI001A941B7E|nr:DUF1415 domain-containing protein [Marinobacter salicampi]
MSSPEPRPCPAIAETRQWLERAVIGLNLCPFARSPYQKQQVRFEVSEARTPEALLDDLLQSLQALAAADPSEWETTLLIHPHVLNDFYDYVDFLAVADHALEVASLDGILQIASFHPDYCFADSDPGAVDNNTNRSPYPTLHLLRETSITRATETMADTDAIYRNNIALLRRLGTEGWNQLWKKDGSKSN